MMTRRRDPAWRFTVMGAGRAPWRPSRDQAQADAVAAGFGYVDDCGEFPPGFRRMVYLHPLAEIETTNALVEVVDRPTIAPPLPARTARRQATARATRIERIIARREGRR